MCDLNQARILVTRPAHQSENLCAIIAAKNGIPIQFPTLEISPILLDCYDVQRLLNQADGIIFTSANAVTLYCSQLDDAKMEKLRTKFCMAIGNATASALTTIGVSVDLMPEQGYNSEALLDLLLHQKKMPRHIIIVRGENGRETLAEALMKCGVLVDYENVYRRVIPTIDCNNVVQLIMQKQLHIITATSGDAIQNLVTMLPLAQHDMLKQLPLVVISERIKNIAKSLGFQWISIANQPSDDAILKAVTTIIHGK